MKSTMLYDWWLRDGMINTDRHLDWPGRRGVARWPAPAHFILRLILHVRSGHGSLLIRYWRASSTSTIHALPNFLALTLPCLHHKFNVLRGTPSIRAASDTGKAAHDSMVCDQLSSAR